MERGCTHELEAQRRQQNGWRCQMGVMGAKNSHVHSGWKQNKRKVEVRKL